MPKILRRISESPLLFHVVISLAALVLIFSRRPDAFLNPQFWAEDGSIWYADAYNHGAIYSLTTPEAGYYQTVSRLVAIFAQLFALSLAPAIFNAAAIGMKLLVANFLASTRLSAAIPDQLVRLAIAFIYIALPHSSETHANLTNVQWHLALLAFLVIVAPGSGKWSKVFDAAVVLISALSGPFCLLLLPIAILRLIVTRDRSGLLPIAILAVGSLIQVSALFTTERPSRQPLGATAELASSIVGGHLFFSGIFGERWHAWLIRQGLWTDIAAIVANILGLLIASYAAFKSKLELRLLICFAVLIIAGALVSPAASSTMPQWIAMAGAGLGSRYWLIPIFCMFAVLIFVATERDAKWFRYAGAAMLALSLIGIASDWRYPRFKDMDFSAQAQRFENAPAGETVVIPINPDWEMRLSKK